MKLKSPKDKGDAFERLWRDKLKDSELDIYAKRSPLSGGIAMIPSDIVTKLPFAFECKRYHKIGIYQWWDQTKRGSSAYKVPVLVVRQDPVRTSFGPPRGEDILVTMEADDWLQLVSYALKADYARQH